MLTDPLLQPESPVVERDEPFRLADHLRQLEAPDPTVQQFVRGWTPENDSAFVVPLFEADRAAAAQIITPDAARERSRVGVVLAVGRGLWDAEQQRLWPVSMRAGDLVCYGKYSGETHDLGGFEVYIMKNVEIKARKPRGTFALVEHLIGTHALTPRYVYHETHMRCEHCAPSTEMQATRDALAEQHRRELGFEDDSTTTTEG